MLVLFTINHNVQANTLVLLAHPDDETWVSGSIAKLSQTQQVHIVYATSGGAGTDRTSLKRKGVALAKAREDESICAAKQLNAQVHFLQLDDRNLELHETELLHHYQKLFEQIKPKLLITFAEDGITGHKDHIFIANIVKKFWLTQANANSHLWQVVVSEKRATIAQQIATQANYPQPIQKPVATDLINLTIKLIEQNEPRIAAFSCYPSQFPPALQQLWQKFVAQTPYEEFIQVSR
ncbi:PIG-L family deacetylase [Catenovulum agarivorans]|uniref:PIG-L family deacetylase n=1 Tax=Catenovulum agarivorans TaxID=1172192 RepID=UPI0002FCE9B8|nr:PIG-L family deacetylase [Catenovulum agarivorans]